MRKPYSRKHDNACPSLSLTLQLSPTHLFFMSQGSDLISQASPALDLILLAGNDMVAIRVPQANGNSDLDLHRIVTLVSDASEMMLAAACSAYSPRPAYLFRRPTQALGYVDSLRALQTTLDDPTITILSQIAPVYRTAPLEAQPFERSVVKGLAGALMAIGEMARAEVSLDHGNGGRACSVALRTRRCG